jgi:hypothetical protein
LPVSAPPDRNHRLPARIALSAPEAGFQVEHLDGLAETDPALRFFQGEAEMPEMIGGCVCGQLRYAAHAEPIFSAVCHCKTCQRQTGTAFRIVVAVPQPAVSIQGSAKTYTRTGDSGQQVINRFCPDCGSTVVIEPEALPGTTIIPAGTLDDTSWLKPTMEIYCDDAQSWVQLSGVVMQRFPKMHHARG